MLKNIKKVINWIIALTAILSALFSVMLIMLINVGHFVVLYFIIGLSVFITAHFIIWSIARSIIKNLKINFDAPRFTENKINKK